MAINETPEHPEHDKLHKVAEQSQACGQFLGWLLGEQHYVLAEYHQHTDSCWPEGENQSEKRRDCGSHEDVLYPAGVNTRKLLAKYFEIDEEKLEAEKLAMLAEIRR